MGASSGLDQLVLLVARDATLYLGPNLAVARDFDWEGDEGQCSHYALMLRAQSIDRRKGILDIRIWLQPC